MKKEIPSLASFIPYVPLYVAVPILYICLFHQFGEPVDLGAFGLGALGWFIALVLRAPVGAIASKLMNKEWTQRTVVLSSGPLEETVRLIVLALTSFSLSQAVSVGQGWAAIEVLYAIIHSVAILTIINRNDEKSAQVLEVLDQQGLDVDTKNHAIGVIERITASAFHIGSTLLIAFNPWLVIVMIPLHSFLNFGASHLMKRSMFAAQLLVALIGFTTLAVGWFVW